MAAALGKRRFDLRKTLWWVTLVLCCAVFAVHFTFVELMNLPTNPIKLQYYDVLEAYVNPFFTQNWSFFAPDPIANDLSLFVRAQRRGADGKRLQSPWYDVTEALIDASNGKPLSPIGSENLALSSAVVQFVNAINKTPSATVVRNGEKFVKPHIRTSIDSADALLMTRIATAALLRHYGGMRLDRVQIALRFYKFPRFSQRRKPDRLQDGHLVTLEWQPAPTVAPL
ncbi:MAG TPA: DUF5819 family protein [Candidatus Baltobacteraceae bacterium]|nr:DUF5819 family protein [Candidatus Baltobacteraceae bacterium]